MPAPQVAPVNYAVDDDQLREVELVARVDEAADALAADPELHLQLVGHADEDNTDDYNEALSQRRAQGVRARMLERHPQLEARVHIVGRGEWDPELSGSDNESKAKNRRVEFRFFYPRVCEPDWSEAFMDCLVGRLEAAPENEEPLVEVLDPVPPPTPRDLGHQYTGLYGMLGMGWEVSSYEQVRHHMGFAGRVGYTWAPTSILRLSAGAGLDYALGFGLLFVDDSAACTDECARRRHIVRILPEGRIGAATGPAWAYLRLFTGAAILHRAPYDTEETTGGDVPVTQTVRVPVSNRAFANLGLGIGFAIQLGRRLVLDVDFDVSFDGRFDRALGVYGGRVSLGAFGGAPVREGK